MAEPSPFVVVNLGQKSETSKIITDSTEPRWEQGFRFLVADPNFQTVELKVSPGNWFHSTSSLVMFC